MKILHVIDSSGLYGAEKVLLSLIDEQRKMGMSPVLLSLGKSDEGPKEIEREAKACCGEIISIRTNSIFKLLSVCKAAISDNVDILHSHGYKGDVVFGLISLFNKANVMISTIHGWAYTRVVSRIWIYSMVDAIFLSRFNAVVQVTPRQINRFRKFIIGFKKVRTILNGIPLSITSDTDNGVEDDIRKFCEKKQFVVGAIGRLSLEKGFEYLIGAIANPIFKGQEIGMILIGEGDERHKLEALIEKLRLSENIKLLGYKKNASKYIGLMDIFVLPSLTEGMPLTVIEAMQAEVPVIASAVGGIPQLLEGNCGKLVKPMCSESLAGAINELRTNNNEAQLIANRGKQKAAKEYSSRKMAQNYKALYESLLISEN